MARFQTHSRTLTHAEKGKYEKNKLHASDFSAFFAAIGLILMVIENEQVINGTYTVDSEASNIVKSFITLSTFCLLICVCCYHFYDIHLTDWRQDLTFTQICIIIIQLILYGVHPVPGDTRFTWTVDPVDEPPKTVIYRVDVILSLVMSSRFYLFLQTYLLHLRMFDYKFYYIGKVNQVEFDLYFKLKTLMTFYPGRVLLVFNAIWLVTSAWYLRISEGAFNENFLDMGNSLWCIIITFLTIGYGDLYPNTVLGRTITILTGFVGIASSSFLITVFKNKLELTKAEELVQNYISKNTNKYEVKNTAALVIQRAWRTHRKRKNEKKKFFGEHWLLRRILNCDIKKFKDAKLDRKKQKFENDHSLEIKQENLMQIQTNVLQTVKEMQKMQKIYTEKMVKLEEAINSLQTKPNNLAINV